MGGRGRVGDRFFPIRPEGGAAELKVERDATGCMKKKSSLDVKNF